MAWTKAGRIKEIQATLEGLKLAVSATNGRNRRKLTEVYQNLQEELRSLGG